MNEITLVFDSINKSYMCMYKREVYNYENTKFCLLLVSVYSVRGLSAEFIHVHILCCTSMNVWFIYSQISISQSFWDYFYKSEYPKCKLILQFFRDIVKVHVNCIKFATFICRLLYAMYRFMQSYR